MNIIWFHDATEYCLPEDIQTIIFPLNTIIIHTNLVDFYLAIEQMKNKEKMMLIVSGPSARQIISFVIEITPIHCIFLIEYQLNSNKLTKQRVHPPSNNFQNENCFFLPSIRQSKNESILINIWTSKDTKPSQLELITVLISIGGILKIFTEILACTTWYILLGPIIKQIHQKCLIQSVRNNSFNYYLDLFDKVLECLPIKWSLTQRGYKILAEFHVLRCEDHRLFLTYSKLVDGYIELNQINDLYYRTNLAYKFSKRPEKIFKSLALYLYNETLNQTDYVKNGCIYGSMALISLEKKHYGMGIHYLNQILNQYMKYNQRPPFDVYLARICTQISLWILTKSRRYLHESLNNLKEIEELVDHYTSKDNYLYAMFLIYMELRRFAYALNCLDRILQENNLESNRLIEVYYGRGHIFLELKDLNVALDNYKKALQLCDATTTAQQFVSIHIAIGIIYERKTDWNEALEHFKQALDIIEEKYQESISFIGGYPASEIIHRHLSFIYEQIDSVDLAENHQKKAVIEKIRLSNLGAKMTWSNDICGYRLCVDLEQAIVAKDYIIPDELLLSECGNWNNMIVSMEK